MAVAPDSSEAKRENRVFMRRDPSINTVRLNACAMTDEEFSGLDRRPVQTANYALKIG
jgi:hypothetical protein